MCQSIDASAVSHLFHLPWMKEQEWQHPLRIDIQANFLSHDEHEHNAMMQTNVGGGLS